MRHLENESAGKALRLGLDRRSMAPLSAALRTGSVKINSLSMKLPVFTEYHEACFAASHKRTKRKSCV